MKKLICIFLIINSSFCLSQTNGHNDEMTTFKREVAFFVDTVKADFQSPDSAYLVFVATFYNDTNTNFCFTLGYILNSINIESLDQNYVYYFRNEVFIVKIDSLKHKKLIKDLGFKRMDDQLYKKIKSRLFDSENGGFTYRGNGLVYCSNGGLPEMTFYKDSDRIPYDKSIFRPLPEGVKVKRVK